MIDRDPLQLCNIRPMASPHKPRLELQKFLNFIQKEVLEKTKLLLSVFKWAILVQQTLADGPCRLPESLQF